MWWSIATYLPHRMTSYTWTQRRFNSGSSPTEGTPLHWGLSYHFGGLFVLQCLQDFLWRCVCPKQDIDFHMWYIMINQSIIIYQNLCDTSSEAPKETKDPSALLIKHPKPRCTSNPAKESSSWHCWRFRNRWCLWQWLVQWCLEAFNMLLYPGVYNICGLIVDDSSVMCFCIVSE